MTFELAQIGVVHSCFKEKFGTPRQAGLVKAAIATLEFFPPYNQTHYFEGLQTCSHIWLSFIFHLVPSDKIKAKVRPPRLGGNTSMGVFATRSPFRPNRLGLSVVKLEALIESDKGIALEVSGVDLVDGTPIVDIKPYVPYADAIANATNTFASSEPSTLPVTFSASAKAQCQALESKYPGFMQLVEEVLAQDPRPSYHAVDDRQYGTRLHGFDIQWQVKTVDAVTRIFVIDVLKHS